ncbi:MAG: efflux transporter periplasmic adaptor subunit [Planctomycetaceae bacterium]|nr:efflux transporter periplasmic adaptor subunit [Planctomycetaceae bacterium]
MSTATPTAPAPSQVVEARPNLLVRRLTPPLLLAAGTVLGAGGLYLFGPAAHPTPTAPAESEKEKEDSSQLTLAHEKWEGAGIRMEAVTAAPMRDHVWRTGRIVVDDDRVAHVSPPVEGLIVEVRARLGQEVAAGTVLAVLESREVGQAKLEFAQAKLSLAAERERNGWASSSAANTTDLVKAVVAGKPSIEIDSAFKDRPVGERRQTLMAAYANRNHLRTQVENQRASAGAVAGSTLQKTESDFEAAEASLRALCEEFKFQATQQARQSELKLKEMSAVFDAARTRLLTLGYTPTQIDAMDPVAEGAAVSRFEVMAPFAGTIVEKHAVRSERVSPQFQMFQIADLSTVWIQADAYEADLPLLRGLGGRGLVFRATSGGVEERPAEMIYSGDLVDRTSRALTVTASAKNEGRVLKPGMYVEVGLPRGGSEPVLNLPASAVQRHQGKTFVFVHVKGDEFRRVDVELGREGGERTEIKGGLKPGDEVVTEGAFVLKSELFRDQLQGE